MEQPAIHETLEFQNERLILIDQTRLPGEVTTLQCSTVEQVHDAIYRLVVRGAPAIGIAAAYGVCLAERGSRTRLSLCDGLPRHQPPNCGEPLLGTRWDASGLDHCDDDTKLYEVLVDEAVMIHNEDRKMCHDIGFEAALLGHCSRILTHCNAGGLATSTRGTALAPIYQLHEQGAQVKVYADETRPLLQGARLTAWELSQAGILSRF